MIKLFKKILKILLNYFIKFEFFHYFRLLCDFLNHLAKKYRQLNFIFFKFINKIKFFLEF